MSPLCHVTETLTASSSRALGLPVPNLFVQTTLADVCSWSLVNAILNCCVSFLLLLRQMSRLSDLKDLKGIHSRAGGQESEVGLAGQNRRVCRVAFSLEHGGVVGGESFPSQAPEAAHIPPFSKPGTFHLSDHSSCLTSPSRPVTTGGKGSPRLRTNMTRLGPPG